MLEVLATWPTPSQLKHAGKARIDTKLKKHGARRHTAWATIILAALDEQHVTVVGTDVAGMVLPHLAASSLPCMPSGPMWPSILETMVQAHPLYPVLTSMPGVAVRTAAIIIASVLRENVQQRRGTGLVRRAGTHHPPVGYLDQVRAGEPFRQQTAQTRLVPLRVRLHPLRPGQPRLLRP